VSYATYDEWRQATPPEYEDAPCPECDGRGHVYVTVRAYFTEIHGFDAETDERDCLRCDGTGRAL
jgi:hypothetical protein